MKVAVKDLQEKVVAGVQKLGYTGEDAEIIVQTLLYAEMRGNNQGISKIATGGVPEASDVEDFHVAKENKCGVLFSGGHSMVATAKAADKAVDLAREHGVGVACVNHIFTSSGAIGYFVRRISQAGYIGFMTVGNGGFSVVAPTGSAEGKMGTNPFAYAIPYEGGEIVFDNATAAIAYFGVVEAMLSGNPLPEDVALDADGNPTTDAKKVLGDDDGEGMNGSIKTFADHKGFGLSLFVQIMGGAFARAGSVNVHEDDGAGTFILAIDPGLLASEEDYMERATKIVEQIKNAKPVEGQEIYMPGEQGDLKTKNVEALGEIEISDGVWSELCKFLGK